MRPLTAAAAAAALALAGIAGIAVAQQAAPPTATGTIARPGTAAPGLAGDDRTAALPVGEQAPPVRARQWLNSRPLTSTDLAGKVVLYDFWTFGCINCRHTQPYVQAWHDRYARDGLVVLSIHTPEFGYEADPANVSRYVRENQVTYPVALDPDSAVWDAFGNRYWPQFYLHDRAGHRRLIRIGEGSYASTEDAIRALLGVPASAPRANVRESGR